jgi:hypothetical protein
MHPLTKDVDLLLGGHHLDLASGFPTMSQL